MNVYGAWAMRHWREWLPERYAAVGQPAPFFDELGLWISEEIARIEFELLPPEHDSETGFMARVGHRGMARLRAEEMVLHVAPAPDSTDTEEDYLPDAWIEIGEALIDHVDDVVLPRRIPR